jgi:hypothetical protein
MWMRLGISLVLATRWFVDDTANEVEVIDPSSDGLQAQSCSVGVWLVAQLMSVRVTICSVSSSAPYNLTGSI